MTRWLKRKGLLREADPDDNFNNECRERSAMDACLEGALGLGELTELAPGGGPGAGETEGDDELEPPRPTKSARRGGQARGFDIHAGVVVAANDRDGRERLLRYCARPPLSLQRLSQLPDGRVVYQLRKPWGSQTHRVMEPLAFMARLAALVPPPRHPLIRFHGVFAPHSSWRSGVVPRTDVEQRADGAPRTAFARCQEIPRRQDHECPRTQGCDHHATGDAPRSNAACSEPWTVASSFCPASRHACCLGWRAATPAGGEALAIAVMPPPLHHPTSAIPALSGPRYAAAPAVCSAACSALPVERTPTGRVSPPGRPPNSPRPNARIEWAELLKRTYDISALACPCGGRLQFIAVITAREVARDILESLGLPSARPPLARARAPDLIDPIPDDW